MSLLDCNSYKEAIKELIKRNRPKWSLRKLSEKLEIQYTYLSKVLNTDSAHLSDDHIFIIQESFSDLSSSESQFLELSRKINSTHLAKRRKNLLEELNALKRRNQLQARPIDAEVESKQITLLLDPYSKLVRLALHIKEYREDPLRISSALGLSYERLRLTLSRLHEANEIEFDAKTTKIKKVEKAHEHLSSTHPWMRANQQLLRPLCSTRLSQLNEDQQTSLMVSFTADRKAKREIEKKIEQVFQEIESIAVNAPNEDLYQLNLELFQWLR